jgi:hypothetical protein
MLDTHGAVGDSVGGHRGRAVVEVKE